MANVVTSIHQPRGAASSDWQVLEAELSRSKAIIYVSGVWSEVGKVEHSHTTQPRHSKPNVTNRRLDDTK